MANLDSSILIAETRERASWTVVAVFTASIFLSAVLLFSVQPMFAKLVLPLLGGSSSVWNTAMVFFQGVLLGGYIYAHVISKFLKLRWQILVHGLVLVFGCLFLPLTIAQNWTPPESGSQAFWLIGLFAVSVGAPFFAISANAPLLQRWFSRTDDKDANDPYFLYAASNAGSLLSLCLYPILFEPMLRLREQTSLWAIGYLLLIIAIMATGLTLLRNQKVEDIVISEEARSRDPLQIKLRLIWIALAFIPSSLMLGVTSHITNNVASAPFLWIMPLALYLLTFIVAFAKKPIVSSQQLAYVTPLAVIGALWFGLLLKQMVLMSIIASLACYFVIALACHMKLVEQRPGPSHLTEFYIWMSLGGVIGGIFNALIAPLVFQNVYEYLLVLLVAFFIGFGVKEDRDSFKIHLQPLLKYGLMSTGVFITLRIIDIHMTQVIFFSGLFLAYGIARQSQTVKWSLVLNLALLFTLAIVISVLGRKDVLTDRSFFSILHVKAETGDHGLVHKFVHGDTIHNYQLRDENLQKVPLAYYAEFNTFDRGLTFARQNVAPANMDIAMVGLGAGAMACYERPEDNWVYFEIDPAVVDMAMNPDYFSYMSQCSLASDVRIGDARLKLNGLPKNSQDYIMIDAFSSDSIPAHLVTKEALALYRSRLKVDGLLFFHTSNKVMDVSSVIVNLAADVGLSSRYIEFTSFEGLKYAKYQTPSSAVLVGTQEQMRAASAFDSEWKQIIASPDVGLWTDDYSHILGTLKAHHRGNKEVLPN